MTDAAEKALEAINGACIHARKRRPESPELEMFEGQFLRDLYDSPCSTKPAFHLTMRV